MNIFDTREEAFEIQFAHEEELRFRAQARRDKLIGLWAAEQIGLKGEAAHSYAADLVIQDIMEKGDDDVIRRIHSDLDAGGVAVSVPDLRIRLDQMMAVALHQVRSGQ